MRVILTGAAGFIGGHVGEALASAGHTVEPIDLKLSRDLCTTTIERRGWPCDTIVHLAAFGGVSRAAREPRSLVANNVDATMALVQACRAVERPPRIIQISSFSVYGPNAADVHDDTIPCPSELYGASKYMQELCWAGWAASPLTILRLSSVYGTGMPREGEDMTILARIAEWIRRGERPRLFEDGQQTRDWVYVGDVCRAILRLIDGEEAPRVVNCCSGDSVSLIDACALVGDAMGARPIVETTGEKRPGDMRHCRGNAAQFMMLLGRLPTQSREGVKLAFGGGL